MLYFDKQLEDDSAQQKKSDLINTFISTITDNKTREKMEGWYALYLGIT